MKLGSKKKTKRSKLNSFRRLRNTCFSKYNIPRVKLEYFSSDILYLTSEKSKSPVFPEGFASIGVFDKKRTFEAVLKATPFSRNRERWCSFHREKRKEETREGEVVIDRRWPPPSERSGDGGERGVSHRKRERCSP